MHLFHMQTHSLWTRAHTAQSSQVLPPSPWLLHAMHKSPWAYPSLGLCLYLLPSSKVWPSKVNAAKLGQDTQSVWLCCAQISEVELVRALYIYLYIYTYTHTNIYIYIYGHRKSSYHTQKKASLRMMQFGNLNLTASSSNYWARSQEFLACLF